MLTVAPTTEEPSKIMQSLKEPDTRVAFIFFVDANFCCVIIEHTEQNVLHVPGEVIESAGVIEDVPWASELLEDRLLPWYEIPKGLISMKIECAPKHVAYSLQMPPWSQC